MTKQLSASQRQNRNDKKRLQNLAKSILHYKETRERIVLQKEPTPAMDILGRKYGLNVYDFYHGTLSPQEQERRRLEYNSKQRDVNKEKAIEERGVYKGTGEQEKKLSKIEQEKEDYFKLPPEEQIAAHKARQLVRDITRGWNCPVCKGIMPEVIDLPEEEQVDYHTVDYNDKCTFIFHIDCYANYLLGKYRSVHQVNSREKMIKDYLAWGHEEEDS